MALRLHSLPWHLLLGVQRGPEAETPPCCPHGFMCPLLSWQTPKIKEMGLKTTENAQLSQSTRCHPAGERRGCPAEQEGTEESLILFVVSLQKQKMHNPWVAITVCRALLWKRSAQPKAAAKRKLTLCHRAPPWVLPPAGSPCKVSSPKLDPYQSSE